MTEQVSTSEKEKTILDAAQKRFARFGLCKVTMDEIALDVGMGKASLYYYFPTKESLFKAVIEREQARFLEKTQTVLRDELTAGEKLQIYIETRLLYLKELINLSTLSVNSFNQMKPIFSDLYEKFYQNELTVVVPILEKGLRDGEFAITNPAETAELILHLMRGLRFVHMKDSDAPSEYESLAKEMGLLTSLVLDGIKVNHAS